MRTRTLVVEGVTYYSEHRKCGHTGCKCGNGELHGPYWYSRDAYGDVKYIGKELPDSIEETVENLGYAKEEIEGARRLLLEQADALRRLSNHDTLTPRQREMIWDMGFGYCLVSVAAAPVEQDGGAR